MGLDNIRSVDYMHSRISSCLQRALLASHPTKPELYKQLISLTDDLRTLNVLHQEKLRACKVAQSSNSVMPAANHPPGVAEWHAKQMKVGRGGFGKGLKRFSRIFWEGLGSFVKDLGGF